MGSKTRVHAFFLSKKKGEQGWPSDDFDPELRRDHLLRKLEGACENIEFVGGDIIQDFDEVKKVEGRRDIDGVLVYTLTTPPWTQTPWVLRERPDVSSFRKHPMILVSDIFGGEMPLLDFCDMARKERLPILPIFSSSFDDLTAALHLIEVIHEMKGSKILNVGASAESIDQAHWWRRDPERYFGLLKEIFGMEVITIGSEELNGYYQSVDEKSARELAHKWISEAVKVIEPSEEEIVNSAKMYLAIKKAMEDMGADAVTIDCLALFYEKKLPAYPCLAWSKLNDEGSTGVCEADLDATVTQFMMRHLTGRPGFVNDPVIDTSTRRVIYAHCVAPTKLFGKDGPAAPCIIRSHAEDGKGACYQVIMPPNETITTVKVNLLERKISIHQGRSMGNIDENRACRTKLVVEANAKKILDNYRYGTFGWHRISFYGDFRKEVRDLAGLLGLEVVEED